MVILSSSSNPLTSRPPPSAGSRVRGLTAQFRAGCSRGSAVWGELMSQGKGLRKMTSKWHIHKGRGRSNSESNGPFSSISRTRNRSTLKQRAQGADFGYFRSVSLSALCDSSLLLGTRHPPFHHSHWISPRLNARATVIPIIISQSSRALCKPRPRFSCL